jgi:hypothetical protein
MAISASPWRPGNVRRANARERARAFSRGRGSWGSESARAVRCAPMARAEGSGGEGHARALAGTYLRNDSFTPHPHSIICEGSDGGFHVFTLVWMFL